MAAANSSVRRVTRGGVKLTTTASISSLASSSPRMLSYMGALASAPRSMGLLTPPLRGQSSAIWRWSSAELRYLQAIALAGVHGQNTRTTDIAQYPHPQAFAQRLRTNHLGHIEELFDGVDPDHPGLAEEGGDGFVRAGQSGGVGRRRPVAAAVRPPLTATMGLDRLS